ncbi:hypothetical protein ACVGVM_29675 (plasmid) [Pseudonocardia bannensis]|uniref:Uncharacterized protein n=1 Tax=Pseudonocardia bannensis TaxID=630973 RepID=A0A848DP77_9PSEU|nr:MULTISPECIES: hypothetical protein [Pseudonocardia]NMH94538.1 hypothetical protein [Pseudonocardia bannensis]
MGTLQPDALRILCGVLARHTAPDQGCFFALWEGWGWIHGSPSVAVINFDGSSSEPVPPAFPPEVLAEPGLEAWPVDPVDSLAYDGDTVNV